MEFLKEENLILVVDDTPANLNVISESLVEAGFEVATAIDGERALKQVQYTLPDLILLDVMMPGIDGFETCRRLKNNPKTKDVPIIFMTALSDTVNKIKGLKLGAVDYVTKPVEHEEILARINVHLELRKAQLKLAQEEKMSSLGQLVAGIAHEINNPVNFISGNLTYAEKYIQQLLQLIELYEIHTPHLIPEIKSYLEEIDIEFIRNDLLNLLSSMLFGSKRIQEIVRSLQVFSRLHEADIKKVDLHVGIESTLTILNNRLKVTSQDSGIQVVKEYGELPMVDCYAAQINQVFMNLLSNAIDAFEEKQATLEPHVNYSPQIKIYTELTAEQKFILIKIADNGIGISREIQKRIFDQFFTTKAVGKGTGLGLSIARQIIMEKHGGTLEFTSVEGKGAEFIIYIPVIPISNNY